MYAVVDALPFSLFCDEKHRYISIQLAFVYMKRGKEHRVPEVFGAGLDADHQRSRRSSVQTQGS